MLLRTSGVPLACARAELNLDSEGYRGLGPPGLPWKLEGRDGGGGGATKKSRAAHFPFWFVLPPPPPSSIPQSTEILDVMNYCS